MVIDRAQYKATPYKAKLSTRSFASMPTSASLEKYCPTPGDLVAYRMNDAYASGTKFRFFVNTNTEAYIYAFATDLSGKVNKILPFDGLMSPHIGPNSTVAFPSDTKVVKMDENKGTDYMLILYSTAKLDVNDVLQKMQNGQGGLSSKMRAALGNKLIEKGDVTYSLDEIGFEVSDLQRGGVVPIMVEITHN